MRLTAAEERLIRLFVAAVTGNGEMLVEVRAQAEPGEPDVRWREALLQVHLFAGFPRTIEAFEVLRRAGGLGSLGPEEMAHEEPAERRIRGEHLFQRIYGEGAERVGLRMAEHHPELARWIKDHAYGRALVRPGLDERMRELLAVSALAVSGPDRQLASHARGAVRCGAHPDEVFDAVAVVDDLMPSERRAVVQMVLHRFAVADFDDV